MDNEQQPTDAFLKQLKTGDQLNSFLPLLVCWSKKFEARRNAVVGMQGRANVSKRTNNTAVGAGIELKKSLPISSPPAPLIAYQYFVN